MAPAASRSHRRPEGGGARPGISSAAPLNLPRARRLFVFKTSMWAFIKCSRAPGGFQAAGDARRLPPPARVPAPSLSPSAKASSAVSSGRAGGRREGTLAAPSPRLNNPTDTPALPLVACAAPSGLRAGVSADRACDPAPTTPRTTGWNSELYLLIQLQCQRWYIANMKTFLNLLQANLPCVSVTSDTTEICN